LNFGNPEKEKNMGEFVECVQGMIEASKYLDYPIVSGNVSFYNETKDKGIKPTPSIGGVGLIKDYKKMVTMDLKEVDNLIIVVGKTEGHLDQSIFARNILAEKKGPPPEINLFNEKNNGEIILKLTDEGFVKSVHDISLGGIMIGLAKMCIKGKKGVKINKIKTLVNKFQYFFGEDQSRYIIEINKHNLKKVKEILNNNSVYYDELGIVVEKDIMIENEPILTVDELIYFNTKWLKEYMLQ
jgi:phosphoribosylformylglycinamidine synthase